MTSEERIGQMQKLGKLTMTIEGAKVRLCLTIRNYSRAQWFFYGVDDAIEQFYLRIESNSNLIEALNR